MNDRGYATLSMFILLPVVLAALLVAASAYLIMKNDGGSRHVCRLTLLQSQEKAAEALKALMALNPEAKLLRAERKAAENAVKNAPDPATKTAAIAALEIVMMEQAALAARQEGWLLKGRMVSRTGPSEAQAAITRLIARARSIQADGNASLDFQASVTPGKFDVVAEPKDSPTPDYKPSPFFTERQAMQVDWSFTVSALLPHWIKPFVGSESLRLRATCSATLEKRGNTWEAKLKADKS